jgi:hypothetical protein
MRCWTYFNRIDIRMCLIRIARATCRKQGHSSGMAFISTPANELALPCCPQGNP